MGLAFEVGEGGGVRTFLVGEVLLAAIFGGASPWLHDDVSGEQLYKTDTCRGDLMVYRV